MVSRASRRSRSSVLALVTNSPVAIRMPRFQAWYTVSRRFVLR